MKRWLLDRWHGALDNLGGNLLFWLLGSSFAALMVCVFWAGAWLQKLMAVNVTLGEVLSGWGLLAVLWSLAAFWKRKPKGAAAHDAEDHAGQVGHGEQGLLEAESEAKLEHVLMRELQEQTRDLRKLRAAQVRDARYIAILVERLRAHNLPIPNPPPQAPGSVMPPSGHHF